MRLFHKVFVCFVLLFGIAFQIAGYLIINYSFSNGIEQQKEYALQEFRYNKYVLQSMLYSEPELMKKEGAEYMKGRFKVPVSVYGMDNKCYFNNINNTDIDNVINIDNQIKLLAGSNKNSNSESDGSTLSYQMCNSANGVYLYVCGLVEQGEAQYILVTECDMGKQIEARDNMIAYFQRVYLIVMCAGFPVIILLTGMLVRSIGKVSWAAKRIAEGNYEERIRISSRDEVGELAEEFNRMADSIEEKIEELSDMARKKEDFTANFAHELKTPLTSIIGYADMIYQKKMSEEQVKKSAEYILNEGMRLEALSVKLMDMFVMDKQDFPLQKLQAVELFDSMNNAILVVCGNNNVGIDIDIGDGNISVDYDLFQTMIINIIDNSVKAGCTYIWVKGHSDNEGYHISIRDNGKGIPQEVLGRITEAFYMVDKSRSRKQHGAGLGMALVSKIAELHNVAMKIESDGKTGTCVRFVFTQEI